MCFWLANVFLLVRPYFSMLALKRVEACGNRRGFRTDRKHSLRKKKKLVSDWPNRYFCFRWCFTTWNSSLCINYRSLLEGGNCIHHRKAEGAFFYKDVWHSNDPSTDNLEEGHNTQGVCCWVREHSMVFEDHDVNTSFFEKQAFGSGVWGWVVIAKMALARRGTDR